MKHIITILAIIALTAIWTSIITAFYLLVNVEIAAMFTFSSAVLTVLRYAFSEELSL